MHAIFCSTDNHNNLVSRLATRRRLAIGEDWSQDVHFGEQSELRYSYHVFCDEYYFGDGCADYCRPRDDTLGHYTCDEEGNRICLEGWKGNYCSERKGLFNHNECGFEQRSQKLSYQSVIEKLSKVKKTKTEFSCSKKKST